jgi:hypothetical protein
MSPGGRVVRLGAWCDVSDLTWRLRTEGRPSRSFSADVHEYAVLADGTRLTLRDDRGWSSHLQVLGDDAGTISRDQWDHITEEHVRQDTLTVVLPDMLADGTESEPVEDHPYDELAELLADHGVHVSADDLRGLPYDVELGPRLTGHFAQDDKQGPVG